MILSQQKLKEVLSYDMLTGEFRWLISPSNNVPIGSVAGNHHSTGYIRIMVFGKVFAAHRLAWLYQTGSLPKNFVDHKNRIKSDNRFSNLRLATKVQNHRNIDLYKSSTSGFKGVSYVKATGKWRSYAYVNYKQIHLGSFVTAELASISYQEFAKKNHGEFYSESNK